MSYSSRNYLDFIYRQSTQTGYVRPVDISNGLHVAKPSVTRAVKILETEGMVRKDPRGGIGLTVLGTAVARISRNKREILRIFFDRTIGDRCTLSDQEMNRIAYSISDEAIRAIEEYLQKAGPENSIIQKAAFR